MTEGNWGPGAGSESLREPEEAEEPPGEEEDPSVEEEQESDEELPTEPDEDQQTFPDFEDFGERDIAGENLFEGTVYDAIDGGEYAFLPVFGFNESNIAARKYSVQNGFEDSDSTIGVREDEPLTIGGKELSWWEDDSIMPKHPYMLVNPLGFASVDPDIHNFREVFRCSKGEQFVFSDSGGYQLMSMTGEDGKQEANIVGSRDEHDFQDYNIYPERLMEWQVENADAGATIDFPPYNISGDSSFPDAAEWGDEWEKFYEMRREKSAQMTERMANRLSSLREEGNEQAEDYMFTPVIHGKPHPDDPHKLIREWHLAMKRSADMGGVQPRGWVLKPEPSKNFGQIALHLAYAEEHLQDADFIHVLMVGGLLQKCLLMYYAMNSDHFVTSDASSYASGGMRRQFDLPKTATRRSVIISSRDDDEDNAATNPNRLDRYPCRCQVCSTVEDDVGFEFVTEGSGSARSVSLNMHNLHSLLNVERTLDALLREDDVTLVETGGDPTGSEFWRFAKTMGQPKAIDNLYKSMDYVRIAQEEGLEQANSTYRVRWQSEDGIQIDRGSKSGAETEWE